MTIPEFEWEQIGFWVNEGPSVIHRHGKFWMTYSASATDENYCMGLLYADENSDLLDPKSWVKAKQPVFKTNWEKKIYGPGHNSFTVDEEGHDLLVYHARDYTEIEGDPLWDPNRHTRIKRLIWKDGFHSSAKRFNPVISVPAICRYCVFERSLYAQQHYPTRLDQGCD
ncbi:family 43 glycosylhydrolase [Vibrio sp. M60_M31a]